MSIAILSEEKIDPLPERFSPPPMTFEEFLAWADEDTHAEWVNGKVVFLSASNWHQLLVGFLFRLINDWVERSGDGGAVWPAPFLMRPRVGLPGREPDIIFLREENFGRLRENYIEGPGDLVIEVVSPESVRRDHVEKFAEYESGGVGEYWIIDPTTQTAEFYVRDAGSKYFRRAPLENLTVDSGGTYTCVLLGGLRIEVDWLWQRPLPALRPIVTEWGKSEVAKNQDETDEV